MATPVSADINSPKVTPSPTTISTNAAYTVTFGTFAGLPTMNTSWIEIEFPSDTKLNAGATPANITITTANGTAVASAATWTSVTRVLRATIGTNYYGQPTNVTVNIALAEGLMNPSSPGSFTARVRTSSETAWVAATAYTIGTPIKVDRFNSSGNFIYTYVGGTPITTAAAAAAIGDKLVVSPGTFTENPTIATNSLTIESLGSAAETIIRGEIDVASGVTGAVIDGFTIQPSTGTSIGLDINGTATIKNCVIKKRSSTTAECLVDVDATTSITDCTFDTTSGDTTDVGIDAAANTTITGCTFTVDTTLAGVDDQAIDSTAGATVKITGCTFTGSSGIGYQDTAGGSTVTITGNTFDGLEEAIDLNAASTVTIRDNTFSNGTQPTSTTYAAQIDANAATSVLIDGNTFTNNAGYAVDVSANANLINMIGNTITGNTKGVRNTDVVNTLMAVINWWGATTGPTIASNPNGTGDPVTATGIVTYKPWATVSPEMARMATIAANGIFDASTTVGVSYSSTAATANVVLSSYDANPTPTAPPYTAVGYYDVFVPAAAGTSTIRLYSTGVTEDTDAYFWSELTQSWVRCGTQGTAGTGGYVWVQITGTSTPSNADLGGTVFALLSAPPAALAAPVLVSPVSGATDTPVRTIFQWQAATGATSYDLEVADNWMFRGETASSGPIVQKFTIGSTVYGLQVDLDYDTSYYWRVRSTTRGTRDEGEKSAWTEGVFHTEKAPVEAEPPVVIEPQPPLPDIVINPPAVTEITPIWIWVIIGVAAVLVIAVIVLIVRTRRPA